MARPAARPWTIILTLMGVVLLVIGWCAYWLIASGMVRDAVEGEVARLASRGITLDCKVRNWSGFPFRFERDCLAPKLVIAGDEIAAQRLLVVMQAYTPGRAVALIDGPVVTRSGISIAHERAMASARFGGKTAWQASLELPKLKVSPYGGAERLLVSARDSGAEHIDVSLDAKSAEALIKTGMLLKLDLASLQASVPRAAFNPDFIRSLARSGEKISNIEARIAKGDLVMTAKGEIGLGPKGEINGHLVTTTSRLDLLMQELRQDYGLSAKDVDTITAMIGLLQPGKTTDVTLDLIVKDGKLYWGPIKLADLKPLL